MLTPREIEHLADLLADRVAERLANRRRLVDRRDLADILSASVPTIDRMIRDGQIPVIRMRGKTLFDPGAVISHLAATSVANEPIAGRAIQ